jgi:ABC-type transporter Mla MlaB component
MLRISITKPTDDSTTLLLEGHLQGAWINELKAACEPLLREKQILSIDLAGVSLIDRPGFEFLASLSNRSVKLVSCSPFQAEQLRRISAAHLQRNEP